MGGRGSGKKSGQRLLPVNVVLLISWLAVFASAMGVVYSTFSARQATRELEILRKESSSLQVRSGQYLLEKSTWAAYSRVEKIATEELNMQIPDSSKTVLVKRR